MFLLNAVTFIGVALVLDRWPRQPSESVLPTERFFGAMRVGLRYARHSPALIAAFMVFASATLSLLPLVVATGLLLGLLAMFRVRLYAGEAMHLDPSRH